MSTIIAHYTSPAGHLYLVQFRREQSTEAVLRLWRWRCDPRLDLDQDGWAAMAEAIRGLAVEMTK